MKQLFGKLAEKRAWFLRAFMVLSLFFPAFYSPKGPGYLGFYYVGFFLPYLALVIYLILSLRRCEEKKKRWFPGGFLVLVLLYEALALYFDTKYLDWYWEGINNTVSFLLFGLLLWHEAEYREEAEAHVRFLILCILGSTLLSILCNLAGWTGVSICNNELYAYVDDVGYETRNYWIYSHKSDYALMLIAFLALVLRWKDVFAGKKKWISYVTLGLLGIALWQTHSWTGIAGALLVVGCFVLDKINWRALKAWYFAVAGVLAAAGAVVVYRIAKERDILSLGGRLDIWKGAFTVIEKYPQGWGMRFGDSMFFATPDWMVNNAHNVFLNAILRFSIPVGVCFTLIFLLVILYTLWRSKDFFAVGMWAGMLMLMMMDYALLSFEVAMVLFCVYFVCICKPKTKQVELVESL